MNKINEGWPVGHDGIPITVGQVVYNIMDDKPTPYSVVDIKHIYHVVTITPHGNEATFVMPHEILVHTPPITPPKTLCKNCAMWDPHPEWCLDLNCRMAAHEYCSRGVLCG